MLNFIYGATTLFLVATTVQLADEALPNDLMYWIDLYMPF